jgi:hypothetical protein
VAVLARQHLRDPIVVRVRTVDDRPRQPAGFVVEVDEALARDGAVEERDDSVAPIEARVGGEPRGQTFVERSSVSERVPGVLRGRVDRCLDAD